MRLRRSAPVAVFFVAALAACGGSSSPPPSSPVPAASADAPAPVASTAQPKEEKKGDAPIAAPSSCANGSDPCTPDPAYVDKLCKSTRTDAALALFAKGKPFTRGYLTRDTDGWNASGGAQSSSKLLFDEEVLVLRKREAGGIVVGKGGGWQVVRWDGSCADLEAEELTLKKPPKPKHAKIDWRNVEKGLRDTLLQDPKVSAAYDKRRKECKGATTGDVSLACVKADAALSDVIVEHVREGGALPDVSLP